MDSAARQPGAADGWGAVVGHLAAGEVTLDAARDVVVHIIQRRNRRSSQVNHHAPGGGDRAEVALRVGRPDGEAVRAFAEGGIRSKRPGTRVVSRDHGNLGAAVENSHHAVCVRCPCKGWRGVVGELAADHRGGGIAHIIRDVGDDRRGGNGIHHDGEARRRTALVPRRIGLADGQDVIALCQDRRGVAPGAGIADYHTVQQHAVVVDGDGIAHRAGAGEGRLVVVGGLAAGQRAGARADVVNHGADGRRARRGEVNGDAGRRRAAAGLAVEGRGHLKGVQPLAKRGWGIAPVAAAVGSDRRDGRHATVQVDSDLASRLSRTGEGWGGVVGRFAFHVADDWVDVIVDGHDYGYVRKIRKRTGDVVSCINAGTSGSIGRGHGQGRAILRGRADRNGETAAGRHPGTNDVTATILNGDECACFGGAGQRCTFWSKAKIARGGWVLGIHRHAQ